MMPSVLMKIFAGLIICVLYVPYVSMEMLTANESKPSSEFVETFEKRCPPGLWCGKKRGIPEEQAMASDDEDQHAEVDAFEKRCPPGLWCGKKRSFSGSTSAEKTNTQIEKDKENVASTFEKRCPPGLWCGKKRQVFGHNENKATEVPEAKKVADQFEKRCPPGLWCGKREFSNQKSVNTAQTEDDPNHSLMKAFEKRCPPGLWCGKKRETSEVKEKSDNSQMKDDPEKFSSVKSEEAKEANKQGPLMDVFEKLCPGGMWCTGKKGATTEEEENRRITEIIELA